MYDKTRTLEELKAQKESWGTVADYMVADVKAQLEDLPTDTFTEEDIEIISWKLGQQYELSIHEAIQQACTE